MRSACGRVAARAAIDFRIGSFQGCMSEGEMPFERPANRRRVAGIIDDPDAPGLDLRPVEVRLANALEKRAVLALEAIERLARSAKALLRHLIGAVEQEGAVGN